VNTKARNIMNKFLHTIRYVFTAALWQGRFLSEGSHYERNDDSVNFEFGGGEFCRECSEPWGGTGILYKLIGRRSQQRDLLRSVRDFWLLLLNRHLLIVLKHEAPARQSWRESKRRGKSKVMKQFDKAEKEFQPV